MAEGPRPHAGYFESNFVQLGLDEADGTWNKLVKLVRARCVWWCPERSRRTALRGVCGSAPSVRGGPRGSAGEPLAARAPRPGLPHRLRAREADRCGLQPPWRESYRVGPKVSSWPKILTVNPY
jgi:hypothetical protein